MDEITATIARIAQGARTASRRIAVLDSRCKNEILHLLGRKLIGAKKSLQQENEKDLESARSQNLSGALIDRLTLSDTVIDGMAAGLEDVAALPDPVGEVTRMWRRPNGLQIARVRIPLGVIGMIYESRPNVTIDAGALCLKSGNAVILRGGKEALHSNRALAALMQEAITECGGPAEAVQVIPITDRRAVPVLLAQRDCIDVIIPRGGESLIKTVYEQSQIPVIAHYKGVCHVYIDESADPAMACAIAVNAKVQRPGVCNAMETLLVHEDFARSHLQALIADFQAAGVRVKGCDRARSLVSGIEAAGENDWGVEYLDLILAVRVVSGFDEAVEHIERYGSKHTEAIVTTRYDRARRFLNVVDASVVLVNASTRFNDGNQLGLGAEIGISTSKMHAFGPMGLEELTTTKFVVYGDGQIRE